MIGGVYTPCENTAQVTQTCLGFERLIIKHSYTSSLTTRSSRGWDSQEGKERPSDG